MKSEEIYNAYYKEIYFFLLGKLKEEHIAKDICQNTFLKAYENLHQLRDKAKVRAWLFQIARNELANYFNSKPEGIPLSQNEDEPVIETDPDPGCPAEFCCFDDFVGELPETYQQVIELVYRQGKKQDEAAALLHISLATVKARIRRSKTILKKKFSACCHYKVDKNGKLSGEPDCIRCNALFDGI